MSPWIRYYFIDCMATFLCVRRNIREHDNESLMALGRNSLMALGSNKSYTGLNNIDVKEAHDGNVMETLVEEVRIITHLIHDQNTQDEIEEEWQLLGKIFDRIFFLVFCFIFIGTGIIFAFHCEILGI